MKAGGRGSWMAAVASFRTTLLWYCHQRTICKWVNAQPPVKAGVDSLHRPDSRIKNILQYYHETLGMSDSNSFYCLELVHTIALFLFIVLLSQVWSPLWLRLIFRLTHWKFPTVEKTVLPFVIDKKITKLNLIKFLFLLF